MSANCLSVFQQPYRGFVPEPHRGISVSQTLWAITPEMKIAGEATVHVRDVVPLDSDNLLQLSKC